MVPARQTRDVGEYVAEMIDFLVQKQNADIKNFHLIGHSLGAHTVGYAGSFTKSGRIPRITGDVQTKSSNNFFCQITNVVLPNRSRSSPSNVRRFGRSRIVAR